MYYEVSFRCLFTQLCQFLFSPACAIKCCIEECGGASSKIEPVLYGMVHWHTSRCSILSSDILRICPSQRTLLDLTCPTKLNEGFTVSSLQLLPVIITRHLAFHPLSDRTIAGAISQASLPCVSIEHTPAIYKPSFRERTLVSFQTGLVSKWLTTAAHEL